MQNNTVLNNYLIIRKLDEGRLGEVYLAKDLHEKNRKVAIKTLKNENISNRLDDIIRFQREAEIISKLTHQNVIKVYEIGENDDYNYIVMEYFEGKSLKYFIENNLSINYDTAVDIMIKICEALDYIHNKNIIHRDLKPSNILVLPEETSLKIKELKLIDFGLSQIKKNELQNINEVVGSLSYISPEQTGVLNKHIDERSDLYSIGIIFYELLAKKTPFSGENISSIIHQHITKKPQTLRNIDENIPIILDKIIFKLLEKEQNDRYQSAEGLLKDLLKYKNGYSDFIPGLDDKILKPHFRTRLIGREKELEILKSGIKGIQEKKGGIYFIKGEAGIGKSRIVDEFKDYILSKGMVIIEGKGFVGKNKIPYGPFKEALNAYIKNFIFYSNVEKVAVKKELKEHLHDLGGIILKLNSNMKEVIGEYPGLVPLEADRELHRFITYSSRFFLKLSEIESGLILYIDDMQWVDEGSFEILSEISRDIYKYPIMIIGTYRDNEITDTHTLKSFNETCKKNQYPLTEILLDYFDKDRMNKFISSLLFDKEENTREISDFVLEKSRGNSFFAIEILKQMINEKAVFQENNKWYIAVEILNKMEISSDIVDILLKRISLLEDIEIKLLSYAAVIGRKFDIDLLFKLGRNIDFGDETNREVIRIVEKVKDLQLLEEDREVKGRILFVHDRIKEAFYQKIGDERRRELHDKIGYTLEEMYKSNKEEVIFDLAYHFIEAGNEEKIIEYVYTAGIKAKESHANEEAIKYLNITKEILEKKGQTGNEKWIIICDEMVGAYLTVGRTNEAIDICKKLLLYKKSNLEKAIVYRKMGTGYFKRGDFKSCEDSFGKGLMLLGEKTSRTNLQLFLSIFKELLVHILHIILPGIFFHNKNKPVRAEDKEIILFYCTLNWMYILININKFICNVLRMLNFAESRIGRSKELGMSIGGYASLCMAIPLFKRSIKYHQKSLILREELKDDWGIGQTLQWMGFCYSWKGEYQKSIEFLLKSRNKFMQIGDMWELGMVDHVLGLDYYYLGNYKEAIKFCLSYLEISERLKDDFGIGSSWNRIVRSSIELGDNDKSKELEQERILELSKKREIRINICTAGIVLGYLNLEKNNFEKALAYLKESKYLYENNQFLKDYTLFVFPYLAETYIGLYNSHIQNNKIIKKEEILKIKKACKTALIKTRSWPNHYGGSLRVTAKYFALVNKKRKAEKFFLKSINFLKKIDRKFELAKSYYEYGNFLNNNFREKESTEQWKKAYSVFKEINSKIYLNKIKNLLNIEDKNESPIQKLTDRIINEQLSSNLLDVIHDIISTEDVYKIIDKIMAIVFEITNAQRGCIILRDKKTGILEILVSLAADKEEIPFESFSLSLIYDVLNSGELIITNNALNDEKYSQYQSIVKYGINAVLCIPIIYKGIIKGICYLDNNLSGFNFIKDNIEKLNLLMAHLLLSLENSSYKICNKIIKIDQDYFVKKSIEYKLTNREMEILSMVIKGFTNKEISKKSSISFSTLKTHINNIYKKIQINNRDEVINIFCKINDN